MKEDVKNKPPARLQRKPLFMGRTAKRGVVMRSFSLKLGLLLVLIPAGASLAEEQQQDDKSYLPPASLRASPKAQPAQQTSQLLAEPGIRKHARIHRHHYRGHAWPRYAFWGFF
jgi:hypothetical protein